MSRNLSEDYKVINLIPATVTTATITGTATDIETYDSDSLIIANVGAVGVNGSVTVTVTGSLTATPSTYDQTLATFTAATTNGVIGATRANLSGIKNIKGVATLPGSTTVTVAVTALVKPFVKASTNNSTTLA